ncbi:MAG: 50S ribosomal protein L24 [Candidatus Hydrothermarchaeales archaeon]
MVSKQPKKQRKALYKARLHRRQKLVSSHLSDTLKARYKRRTVGLRKGDTVEVLRGDFAGHKGKVEKVSLKRLRINVSGASVKRTDGTDRYYPIHPSNVVITKLDTTDERRMKKLKSGKK